MKQYNICVKFERIIVDAAGPFPTGLDASWLPWIMLASDLKLTLSQIKKHEQTQHYQFIMYSADLEYHLN